MNNLTEELAFEMIDVETVSHDAVKSLFDSKNDDDLISMWVCLRFALVQSEELDSLRTTPTFKNCMETINLIIDQLLNREYEQRLYESARECNHFTIADHFTEKTRFEHKKYLDAFKMLVDIMDKLKPERGSWFGGGITFDLQLFDLVSIVGALDFLVNMSESISNKQKQILNNALAEVD